MSPAVQASLIMKTGLEMRVVARMRNLSTWGSSQLVSERCDVAKAQCGFSPQLHSIELQKRKLTDCQTARDTCGSRDGISVHPRKATSHHKRCNNCLRAVKASLEVHEYIVQTAKSNDFLAVEGCLQSLKGNNLWRIQPK